MIFQNEFEFTVNKVQCIYFLNSRKCNICNVINLCIS